MTPATQLEETLVAAGCDSVWFGGRLSLQSTLCSAVVVVPTLNLLWALSSIGKSCETVLWPFLCHPSPVWMVFPENLECVDASSQGNPAKREGIPQALGSYGPRPQFNRTSFLRISLFMVQLRLSCSSGFRWWLLKAIFFLGFGQCGNKKDLTI